MKIKIKKIGLFSLLGMFLISAHANVRLPKIFGDNMVLQRNQPISVWGWADPNETITISFHEQRLTFRPDAGSELGKWAFSLNAEQAGGPYELVISGNNTVVFKNVLVGEVWVCSGQSNMEMPIEGWGKVNNYQQEIAAANYDQIRHFKVPNTIATNPKEDLSGGDWKICSPSTAGDFSALGYFFARELYNQLHVPIGLINTSWGGTNIETWTSRPAFEHSDEFRTMIDGMQIMNIDSLAGLRKQGVLAHIAALQGPLETKELTDTWSGKDIDDRQWKTMKIPGLWEGQGLGLEDLDGTVWFRKTIILSSVDSGSPASIDLAMIDDDDISYVNGIKIGATDGYNISRKYQVPAGILKAGKNVIAVRVLDHGGGGGIYGDSANLKLSVGAHVFSLAGEWAFRVADVLPGTLSPNSYPTLLFNSMLNPLIPFAIKGVIWYQGEANAGRAYQYRKAFPLMITDWRKHWGQGDFPFYFVQLASFNAGAENNSKGSPWAELREAQTLALSLPNTGMAVTTDIGNPVDVHPKNKQEVGRRLGAIALNQLYGKKMEYSGPLYKSMKISGNKISISFTHLGGGLLVKDKEGLLKGFEIAGADQQFHPCIANIDGDQVVLYLQGLNQPVAARYAWANNAGDANLFNRDGFPAVSFRTDQWKGVTEGAKYSFGN
jgi:sialate O-acetylesterase